MRKQRTKKKHIANFIIRFFLGVILIIVISFTLYKGGGYAFQKIIAKFINIEVVEYGVMQDSFNTTAIVLFEEDVWYAPSEGSFENTVREKEKVRIDTKVGYFNTNRNKSLIKARVAGIFTKNVDGLEKALYSVNVDTVSDEIFEYKRKKKIDNKSNYYADEPVFKIINNLKGNKLLIKIPEEKYEKIKKVNSVRVIWQDINYGSAIIENISEDTNYMIIRLPLFYEEFLDNRFIDIELIYNQESGFIIKSSALTEKDNKKGIYCIRGERVRFQEVEIVELREDLAIIDGLQLNEMYITNPKLYLKTKKE